MFRKRRNKLPMLEIRKWTSQQILQLWKEKKYYKQYYANNFYNVHKISKFPERHKLGKLTQEEIDNLYYSIFVFKKMRSI